MIKTTNHKGVGIRIYLVQKSDRKSIGSMVRSSYFFIPNQKETIDATRHDSITFTSASLETRGVMELNLKVFPSMAVVLAAAIKKKQKLKFEIKFTDVQNKRICGWAFAGRISKLELLADSNDNLSVKLVDSPKSRKKYKPEEDSEWGI